jgi:hypothetical protein
MSTSYREYIKSNFHSKRDELNGAPATAVMSALAAEWRATSGKPPGVKKSRSPGVRKCGKVAEAKCAKNGKVCHVGAKRRSCRKSPTVVLSARHSHKLSARRSHKLSVRRSHKLSARRSHSRKLKLSVRRSHSRKLQLSIRKLKLAIRRSLSRK